MVLNQSGMVFKGTTGAYKRICLFQLQMNSREREVSKMYHSSWILPIDVDFVDAKLNYGKSKVWKRLGKMACFGLKLGQDLGNRAAHPTENSEELSSGHFPYLNLGIFFYSVKKNIYLFIQKFVLFP